MVAAAADWASKKVKTKALLIENFTSTESM
jgi:hypothetical protein